jgi:glycosyltransferase involved in cell wall biosynthesis
MHRVDVIIPTYNRKNLLRRAITSVLNQSFTDFVIIVVDDCSSDNIKLLLESFQDNRIKCVRNEVNMGEGGARNIGISNSTADYVAFLDDDDEWSPAKLKMQLDLLESQRAKVGGVYTSFTAVEDPSGEELYHRIVEKRGDLYERMVQGNVVGTPSTVFLRRECFERVGPFDESIPYGVDYDMWIRISKEYHFDCIEQSLVTYHVHGGQLTSNLGRLIAGQEAMLSKYDQFFGLDRKTYRKRFAQLSYRYRENGDLRKAWKALLKGIRVYPRVKEDYVSLAKLCVLSAFGPAHFQRLRTKKNGTIVPRDWRKFKVIL